MLPCVTRIDRLREEGSHNMIGIYRMARLMRGVKSLLMRYECGELRVASVDAARARGVTDRGHARYCDRTIIDDG